MSQVSLRAEPGRVSGSSEARRIRAGGQVPAIVYGKGMEPVSVSVDARELHNALHTEAGSNALINLDIEGSDTMLTMARVIEKHPFRSEYRHIDFVAISLDETTTVEVHIDFQGTPVGVREGGVFSPRRTAVTVECLVTAIPSSIELDVSGVEIGGSLRVEDLPELEGVTYMDELDAVVMSVTTPAAEIEEPVVEEEDLELEEGEEPAEGEADETADAEAESADEQEGGNAE
jgi:large subunit ribosomal protein L25